MRKNDDVKIILLLAFVILLVFFPLRERWQMEADRNRVEIIMSGNEFQEIKALDDEVSWNSLVEAGVKRASLSAHTLDDLQERGKIAITTPAESGLVQGISESIDSEFTGREAVSGRLVYFPEQNSHLLSDSIISLWKELFGVRTTKYQGGNLLLFPVWTDFFEDLQPGYDEKMLSEIEAAGLKPAARLKNQPSQSLNEALLQELNRKNVGAVIFTGEEVAGYPDHLHETARFMSDRDLIYGYIEPFIGDQEGASVLAKQQVDNVVRVHSIQREEMAEQSREEIRDRYIRAARERNVSYLYLRGLPEERIFRNGAEEQLVLAGIISAGLEDNGFELSNVLPGGAVHFGAYRVFFSSFLVMTAAVLWLKKALDFMINLPGLFFPLLMIAGFIVLLFLFFTQDLIFFRQFTALGAAAFFPAVSGGFLVEYIRGDRSFLSAGLAAAAVAFSGGLLVAAVLSTSVFYNQIEVFRGVKLAFVLPLFLTGLYFLMAHFPGEETEIEPGAVNLVRRAQEAVATPLTWKQIFIMSAALIVMVVYLGRTGNIPFIPVPAPEIALREWLEGVLGVRPRFKEFLLGHPFLLLLPFFKKNIFPPLIKTAVILLALIGQLTVVNSFSHLHTPLSVTLERTVHGYWLAFPAAAAIFALTVMGIKLYYVLPGRPQGRENA